MKRMSLKEIVNSKVQDIFIKNSIFLDNFKNVETFSSLTDVQLQNLKQIASLQVNDNTLESNIKEYMEKNIINDNIKNILANYNAKKKAIVYYIWAKYLDAIKNISNNNNELTGQIDTLKTSLSELEKQCNDEREASKKELQDLKNKIDQCNSEKNNTAKQLQNTKNAGEKESLLHSENIKKLQNNTNAKIKELQNTSQKLKDEYEKKLSNSNAKCGETQGETERILAKASETQQKMQDELNALKDLLKQSWPILSETLSNTEIGQALK